MNGETSDRLPSAPHSRKLKSWRRLGLLVILAAAALIDFLVLGLARRTFVFYTIDDGAVTVEERMLRVSRGNAMSSSSRELDITKYVEETLLGPGSPDFLPLFPRETRLRSLLYRNGVVYADLSEDAAMPPPEGLPLQGSEVYKNFATLRSGIKRNFPFVRDQRFFIAGNAAYAEAAHAAEFRRTGGFSGSERD